MAKKYLSLERLTDYDALIKAYTDAAIASISTPDVSGQINAHNTDSSAHSDIRSQLTSKANTSDLTSHTSNKSNPHGVTLSQLNVTATATELNYVAGVTSSVQEQLNTKLNSNLAHIWRGSYTGSIDDNTLNGTYWINITGENPAVTGTFPTPDAQMPSGFNQYGILIANTRYQKLVKYSNDGITAIWERYYTNNKWYAWIRTDGFYIDGGEW